VDPETMLGLNVRDLDRQTIDRLDLPRQTRGVLITRVEPMSSAFDGGVDRGTVLLEINRQHIESVADYRRFAGTVHPGEVVTLYVYAPEIGQRQLKTIRLEDR
jgi:S1-C subfamily serine protease